jgi:Domain of unknown function (DUF4440)
MVIACSMRRRLGCLLLVCSTVAGAQTPSAAEAKLLQFEDQLFAADVHHDVAFIQKGFADEAFFVHANGKAETKSEYLKELDGHNFESVIGVDRVVRIFGETGVVRGTKNLVLANGMHLSGSYLTIYIMRGGRWQMLDEQSSPAMKPPEAK